MREICKRRMYIIKLTLCLLRLTISRPVVTVCTTSFNVLKLCCILHKECMYVFRMILTINSDCFSTH
jgi:hypothetical protein